MKENIDPKLMVRRLEDDYYAYMISMGTQNFEEYLADYMKTKEMAAQVLSEEYIQQIELRVMTSVIKGA